jgi:Tfp pilus assembly protein PilF
LAERFAQSDQYYGLDTLGWAYYRNGDFSQAESVLDRALTLAREFVDDVRSTRGEGAAASAENAIAVVHYHLGMAYLANQNRDEGKQELAEALADPNVSFPGIEEARATLTRLSG